jgi:hypothetical protein
MFCRYCGNELPENAVVCLKCGCLVNGTIANVAQNEPIAPQTIETQTKKPSRNSGRTAKILSIIGLSANGLTLLCGLFFLFMLFFGFAIGDDEGILFVLLSVFPLLATIGIAPIALVLGILAFVFKKKASQPAGSLPIVAFIWGIVTFVISWGMYFNLTLFGA